MHVVHTVMEAFTWANPLPCRQLRFISLDLSMNNGRTSSAILLPASSYNDVWWQMMRANQAVTLPYTLSHPWRPRLQVENSEVCACLCLADTSACLAGLLLQVALGHVLQRQEYVQVTHTVTRTQGHAGFSHMMLQQCTHPPAALSRSLL
jgi:hypothetical protein